MIKNNVNRLGKLERREKMFPQIKEMAQICRRANKINIAGAGVGAREVLNIIQDIGYRDKIACFIVSVKEGMPMQLEEMRI